MEQKRNKTQTSQRTQTQDRRTAQKPAEPMSRDELRSKRNLERRKKRRRNKIIGYTVIIILIIVLWFVFHTTIISDKSPQITKKIESKLGLNKKNKK